jgi:lysophospholipase L1-like esterase
MKKIKLALLLLSLVPSLETLAQQQPSTERWARELNRFDEADRQRPPKPGSILFIGSSSIRMWTTLSDDFPSLDVINRGFGGSRIADSVNLAGRLIIPYKPRMIVFYAGDNDLAAGNTTDQVLGDFKAFVEQVRKDLPAVKIAFVSIKPSIAREHLMEKMREANAKVRDFAARQKDMVYIDVFTPMLTKDGKPRPELFVEDRLHMNRQGYELWKSIIGPVLR